MKEDFTYSRRMHEERTLKPAKRKEWRELAASVALIALLIVGALDRDFADWLVDHPALLLLASLMAWGMRQLGQMQHSRQDL